DPRPGSSGRQAKSCRDACGDSRTKPPGARLSATAPSDIGHNGLVSTAALAPPTVNRPNVTQVGVIVWLGSEVMFFAGIFAIYFTLRSTSPELWAIETEKLTVPFSSVNTAVLVLSSFTAQFGVFAAERLQAKRLGSR